MGSGIIVILVNSREIRTAAFVVTAKLVNAFGA
jgi:hypothetical protein